MANKKRTVGVPSASLTHLGDRCLSLVFELFYDSVRWEARSGDSRVRGSRSQEVHAVSGGTRWPRCVVLYSAGRFVSLFLVDFHMCSFSGFSLELFFFFWEREQECSGGGGGQRDRKGERESIPGRLPTHHGVQSRA